MAIRKDSQSEKLDAITCKIDSVKKRQFQEMVERDGFTTSQVIRAFIERFINLRGSQVKQ